MSGYAAQLMEAEGLHGFCFFRKPWQEMPHYYRNSLILCAVNPFEIIGLERLGAIVDQLDEDRVHDLLQAPKHAFHGRLISIAQRVLDDTLKEEYESELELAMWSGMVTSLIEVVFT